MEKLEGVVTSKGQLVIPAKLRRAMRIGAGTRVRFERIKGGIAVYPKQFDDIERFHGIFAGLGLPPDIEKEPDREIE
jgi:AbrB family looped-hinge helix DNA binding protein